MIHALRRALLTAAAGALAAASPAAAEQTPAAPAAAPAAAYAAALADPARPEADRARDAVRKPAELLAFAQVQPGQKVGDWFMGGGYLTRVLAAAVGAEGRVHAFQPDEFVARRTQMGEIQAAIDAAYANVEAVKGPLAAAAFPAGLDAVITVQNFHDMYHEGYAADTAQRAAKGWFDALRPGGALVIVDHSAPDGTGVRDADKLHRIDKRTVIDIVEAAGFKLEAEGDLFRRPADPRTASVFDPAIRGQTDQFTLRFRKPR